MMHSGLVIAVATAAINFGIIQEHDGKVSHRFMLHNENPVAVRICQTFPSCGCTTISCDTGLVAPHDSVAVDVAFDPVNRGGDFYETASVVMASSTDTTVVTLSVEGTIVTSEETLIKQYPVRQGEVRLTNDTLYMGEVRRGESKTMYVGVLRNLQTGQCESLPVTFTADNTVQWGALSKTRRIAIDKKHKDVAIVVKAIVLPNFSNVAPPPAGLPQISCPRRMEKTATTLHVSNSGKSSLLIYRAYTDEETDLAGKYPITIPPSGYHDLSLGHLPANIHRITLITNDRRRPRVNVFLLP